MPTYEYQCRRCDFRFERFQGMLDKPLSHCPKCNGKAQRLISAGAGFLFKGNGFYTTDYRSSSYKEKAKKEKSTNSDPCSGKPSSCEKPSCPSKN